MRIVVTRPHRSGEKTAAKLEALGHEPVLLPLFHPVHHGQRAIPALSDPLSAIAATSAEALRSLETLRDRLAPHWSKPLFAVGEATAEAAEKIGFTNIFTASGDAVSLAGLVAEHRSLLKNGAPPALSRRYAPRHRVRRRSCCCRDPIPGSRLLRNAAVRSFGRYA